MKRLYAFLRVVMFMLCTFFGIAAIAVAALAVECRDYYNTRKAVEKTRQSNKKIEQIIKDHDTLTAQIENDPNILSKIAPLTLGTNYDTNMPKAQLTDAMLEQAYSVLQNSEHQDEGQMPKQLARCTKTGSRIILFISGAGLITIGFVSFRATSVKSA